MTKIKGLDRLLKELNKLEKGIEKDIDKSLEDNANEIAVKARQNVTKVAFDTGKLAQSIWYEDNGNLKYTVFASASYAPYVEYGTGTKVSVPKELRDNASQFKGKGRGSFEDGLKMIEEWCKRKGIPQNAAYPIFMSILKKGTSPKPFLYPAFVNQKKQIIKDLENLLDDKTKKI